MNTQIKAAILGLIISMIFCPERIMAQESDQLPDGLQLINTLGCFGLQDDNGNVIVSAEYDSLRFHNGMAILTKGDYVYGRVSDKGEAVLFSQPYLFHKRYPFYSEGYLVVGRDAVLSKSKTQWLYIDEYGLPLEGRIKFFGYAEPFFYGYAVVRDYVHIGSKQGKLRHIDMSGNERFIMNDSEIIHRSAVYWGGKDEDKSECVIITESGIHFCQEDGNVAVIKETLYRGDVIERYEEPYSYGDSSGGVLLFNKNGQAEIYAPEGEPLRWLIPLKTE